MKAGTGADATSKLFRTLAEWEQWLETHAGDAEVWVRIAKKGSGETSIGQMEAIDGALCYGWIDGQKRALDEKFFILRFTPRRPRSLWSKINVDKAERLMAEGCMRPAGLRQVDMAKADGRWEAAYEGASRMEIPEELAAGLAKNAKACRFFEQLDGVNRYAFCWRVQTAKKPETRRAKAAQFVEMLARGEKIHG